MVGVVFAMASSFLGVWEIPIPGFVGSGAAGEVAARGGRAGAFSKGALATILATPCSGPLLGAVFAYTLKQPTPVIYTIFGSIGLGMCVPVSADRRLSALDPFLAQARRVDGDVQRDDGLRAAGHDRVSVHRDAG